MVEENPKNAVTVVDSSSLVLTLSDSEKAAIKDSSNLELKKPMNHMKLMGIDTDSP